MHEANIWFHAGNVSNMVPQHNCCKERDQPWHYVLASMSDSHVLTGTLYARQFLQVQRAGLNLIIYYLSWRTVSDVHSCL